jgi:hypothetical protein
MHHTTDLSNADRVELARSAVGAFLATDLRREFAPGDGTEPVKHFETLSYDAFCASSSSRTGSLIQAMVGSLGGTGLRGRNRAGLVA